MSPGRLIVLLLVAPSCGDANGPRARLEGSLSTVMDLGYDEVQLKIGRAHV